MLHDHEVHVPTPDDIVRRRLAAHGLARAQHRNPAELVAAMGAIQGQDYLASKWAIGVRVGGATDAAVERAISEGAVIRTHPLRNTLHLVAAADVRWMLSLTADRMLARTAPRYRQLGLDAKTFARSEAAMTRALRGGVQLARKELTDVLAGAGIETSEQRFSHLVHHAELVGLLCSGARRGKQLTFALLDDWIPASARLDRDAALAELARRYFTTRGPATAADLAWWSGLAPADVRDAIAMLADELVHDEVLGTSYWSGPAARLRASNDRAHLLPAFDEYAVAYRDRSAISDGSVRITEGGMLAPIAVVDGRVIGTWRRTLDGTRVVVAIAPSRALGSDEIAALEAAAARYADFLGLDGVVRISRVAKRAVGRITR